MTGDIIGINERWVPVGGSSGMDRRPMTVVLVEGAIGDYAAYIGWGGKEHAEDIARFGDKLSYPEACCHFPIGLEEERYRL
jgi:hypothetical protein